MRTNFLALLVLHTLVAQSWAVSVALNGGPVGTLPDISVELDKATSIRVELVNQSAIPVQLTFAQVSLSIRPTVDSSGELALSLGSGMPSIFGSLAFDVAPQEEIVTAQAGALPPFVMLPSLQVGKRGPLAELIVAPTAGSRGRFELLANDFMPLDLLQSSHWGQPGIFGGVGYQNDGFGSGMAVVLANLVIAVPDPSATTLAWLAVAIAFGARPSHCLASRRSWGRQPATG